MAAMRSGIEVESVSRIAPKARPGNSRGLLGQAESAAMPAAYESRTEFRTTMAAVCFDYAP